MAKKRVKNNKKKMALPRRVRGPALDSAAAAYARLLADPCGAPIVHPIAPGGDTGFLIRCESFASYGLAGTETSGYFHWTPGYMNSSNTEVLAKGSTGPTVAAPATVDTSAPGKTFFNANAKGLRCVAACLKFTYPGSESGRSGRVHYGHTTAGIIDSTQNVTPDAVAQSCQHYSRTPTDTVELYWKPNAADFEFNDPSEAASALIRDRKSALTVAWAGFPGGVGLTFHMTAVYEWTPATGVGVAHDAVGKSISRNTFDDVLDSLINAGFTFVRAAGHSAGTMLSAGLMNALGSTYGLMPANGRARARQQLTN